MAKWCVQTVKAAMKKAILSNRDINMSLLYLRSTPIDHVIPSSGELLFNGKLVSNLPTKCTNQNFRKEEIQDHLLQRQLFQKRQHDEYAKDLPNLCVGQRVQVQDQDTRRWTPAVVRQAYTEPRSYIVETPSGQVLRRNRRHLKEDVYTSNTTQAFLHNTPLHHTQLKTPNIPKILPAETTNTHTNICTPSAETHRPVHRTQSSNNKPSGTITRSGRIVNPPKGTTHRKCSYLKPLRQTLLEQSFLWWKKDVMIWIILFCCFGCTSYMPLRKNKNGCSYSTHFSLSILCKYYLFVLTNSIIKGTTSIPISSPYTIRTPDSIWARDFDISPVSVFRLLSFGKSNALLETVCYLQVCTSLIFILVKYFFQTKVTIFWAK